MVKSTLVRSWPGSTRPTCEYLFEGKPVKRQEAHDATGARHPDGSSGPVALVRTSRGAKPVPRREKTCGGPGWRISRAESEVRAREVMTRMRLGTLSLTRPVGAMSGGQRQNIAIARSILWTPKVVIPTSRPRRSATRAEQVGTPDPHLADQGLGIVGEPRHPPLRRQLHRPHRRHAPGANAASFRSKDVTGEQVVNAMVGGNEGVNLAG